MSIYIGNLSHKVEEDDLKRVFEEYGTVKKVQLLTNHTTGTNRGFAIVEMDTTAEEISAIQMLRNTELMGTLIKVNRAMTELEEISSRSW